MQTLGAEGMGEEKPAQAQPAMAEFNAVGQKLARGRWVAGLGPRRQGFCPLPQLAHQNTGVSR